jgi:DNA-binding phage protein
VSHLHIAASLVVTLTLLGCPGAAFEAPRKEDQTSAAEAPAVAEAVPAEDDAPAEAAPAEAQQPRQNALEREAELVDRRAYLEAHPNAIELEKNVINASDPFTASAQGYFAAVSTLTQAAYEHDLQLQKALNNDRWPTFAAYKTILDTHGVKLKGLKKRQVYAYDDQTGQISILELPEEQPAP